MSLNSEKLVRALHHKKYRNNHNKFILEGKRTIDFANNNYGNFSLIIYTKKLLKAIPMPDPKGREKRKEERIKNN